MRRVLRNICFLAIGVALGDNSIARELELHLSADMLGNSEYSDQYVLSLIESDINNSNLDSNRLVVQSLGLYAEKLLYENSDNTIHLRPIHDVPNLRDYLITYYQMTGNNKDSSFFENLIKAINELPFIESKSYPELELADRLENLEGNPEDHHL